MRKRKRRWRKRRRKSWSRSSSSSSSSSRWRSLSRSRSRFRSRDLLRSCGTQTGGQEGAGEGTGEGEGGRGKRRCQNQSVMESSNRSVCQKHEEVVVGTRIGSVSWWISRKFLKTGSSKYLRPWICSRLMISLNILVEYVNFIGVGIYSLAIIIPVTYNEWKLNWLSS